MGKTVSGKIIIAASTIPSAYVLPKLAADFNKAYPGVSFEIRTADTGQVVEMVLGNEILLGVVGAPNESTKLNVHAFREDELVLAASTKRKINRRITTKSLLELPFLLREEGSGTRKSIEHFLAEENINVSQLNTRAILGSSTAICEAIKSDFGVSILSSHAIAEGVAHDQIQVVDILNLKMLRNFYTVTTKKRSLPRHYQVFLKYLLPQEISINQNP